MYDMETKMLLKHYLEQGVSKAELTRRFRLSRRTIHYWIESGQMDRELHAGAGGYALRAPIARKLDPYKEIIEARLEAYPKLTAQRLYEEVRSAGVRGQLRRRAGLRAPGPAAGESGTRSAVRDASGAPAPGGLRMLSAALGTASRIAGGAGLLTATVAAVFPATDYGGAVRRSGECVQALRGRAGRAAVRPDAVGGGVRRPPGGRGADAERGVLALRGALGVPAASAPSRCRPEPRWRSMAGPRPPGSPPGPYRGVWIRAGASVPVRSWLRRSSRRSSTTPARPASAISRRMIYGAPPPSSPTCRAPLEQIQISLGHASIQTTERYLGLKQNLHDAPCDRLGLVGWEG